MKYKFNDGSVSEQLPPQCKPCIDKNRNPLKCVTEEVGESSYKCPLCKKLTTLVATELEVKS